MSRIVNPVAARVVSAIMDHEAFDESVEIHASEKGGVVTLKGKVPSKPHLELAESISQNIKGVSSVINQLEIDPELEDQTDLLNLKDETQVPPARSGPHARN